MKKNHFKVLFSLLFMAVFMMGCENNLEMVLPQGPRGEKGDRGDKGDPGASAFELWKLFYDKDPNTPMEEFFESLRGPQGFTPVPNENGNWFINGEDTGKPWRGEDGKTPKVEIGPGPDYFWIIDGETTNISAKGQDGKDGKDGKDGVDGFTPVIGPNGNWFIDGVDTGKPSVIIPEIGPGPNFHWFIDGVDTGKPSRGADGAPGKTAYELWKEHLGDNCDGTITKNDNDKTPWPCGRDSWEDFLEWLQGGNVSVLHQYWTTLPGNEGKTIERFIEELFDCHCDGITVGLQYEDTCVELNPDGTVRGTYNATLSIGGKAGTSVRVTGNGVNLSGNITNDQTPIVFNIARCDDNIDLTIVCTEGGNAVTKGARIPALKYIKLEGAATVTPVADEEKDVVVINFATAPVEVSVGGTVIFESDAITQAGNAAGWAVSNEGKTFTKTYNRIAAAQRPTVQAKGADPICSTIADAFTIPQLTPIEVGLKDVELALDGDCDLNLTLTAPAGMDVKASYGNNPRTTVDFVYATGVYTATIPRLRSVSAYNTLTVTVSDPNGNAGTVELKPTINSTHILPVPFTVTWTDLKSVNPRVTGGNTSYPFVEGTFKNNLNKPIDIVISRNGNMANERVPWIQGNAAGVNTQTVTLAANETRIIIFQRDVTPTFASGSYAITSSTESQCLPFSAANKTINNQNDFNYLFRKITDTPGGYPGGPGGGNGGSSPYDPDYPVPTPEEGYTIFELVITDAIPNTFVQFLLNTSDGMKSVTGGSKQVNENGTLTILIKMKDSDLAIADGGIAEIKFFNTKTSSTATHTKVINPFNAPQ